MSCSILGCAMHFQEGQQNQGDVGSLVASVALRTGLCSLVFAPMRDMLVHSILDRKSWNSNLLSSFYQVLSISAIFYQFLWISFKLRICVFLILIRSRASSLARFGRNKVGRETRLGLRPRHESGHHGLARLMVKPNIKYWFVSWWSLVSSIGSSHVKA